MYPTKTWHEKIKLFIQILWPILVTQITMNMMNLVDTLMSGRAGTNDLAGVAIGSSLWLPIFTGIGGLWMAVTPLVAQDLGQKRLERIPHHVMQALYLSILVSVFVIICGGSILDPMLYFLSLESEVQYIAKHYLIGLTFGIIPLFASLVLRNFFDAQGYTRITMQMMLLAVPVNVLLNYLLIFGNWGFPQLGGIGAGYATALTYWILLLMSVWMTFRVEAMQHFQLFKVWPKPSWKAWKDHLKIGMPIGLTIFFESSIFAVVTLLMGLQFDTVTVAAHQVAFSITTTIFIFALSISMALTILVAYEVGAGRMKDARQYTRIGVTTSVSILACFSIALFFLRGQIISFYSTEAAVINMGKQFLMFAIFYQLSDATQASLQGVLRGYKDVTVPFIIALISYWIIGIPSGYVLSSFTALGPFGYWIGISIGLSSAALGFLLRLNWLKKQKRVRSLKKES